MRYTIQIDITRGDGKETISQAMKDHLDEAVQTAAEGLSIDDFEPESGADNVPFEVSVEETKRGQATTERTPR